MFERELYTNEELKQMIDNTKGFYDYCKLQDQIERDTDFYNAFSWLFNPNFIPLPINLELAKNLTKSELWWIQQKIRKQFRRAWNTPPEFMIYTKR